jgi:hypothetical protein
MPRNKIKQNVHFTTLKGPLPVLDHICHVHVKQISFINAIFQSGDRGTWVKDRKYLCKIYFHTKS